MAIETLRIDSAVIQKLREHAFKKHGKLYGMVKKEAEAAILAHVGEDEG